MQKTRIKNHKNIAWIHLWNSFCCGIGPALLRNVCHFFKQSHKGCIQILGGNSDVVMQVHPFWKSVTVSKGIEQHTFERIISILKAFRRKQYTS